MPQITSQKTINVKIGFIGICPACAQDSLKREGYFRTVEHKGSSGKIKQFKNVCGNCHIELFDEDCSRENRRSWVVFQKHVEGVPTGAEIKAMRIAVGLTSEEAGNLLGGGPKAFSKYENEEIVPHGAMRTLLLTLIKFPNLIHEIKLAKGIDPIRSEPQTPRKIRDVGLYDLGHHFFRSVGIGSADKEILFAISPRGLALEQRTTIPAPTATTRGQVHRAVFSEDFIETDLPRPVRRPSGRSRQRISNFSVSHGKGH